MDYNYTLKYRTFDELLEDVKMDLPGLSLENKIEPATLIKIAIKSNYDLGLRIYMTKEVVLEVEKGRVRLPDDFFVMNFALLCGDYEVSFVPPQGTNVQEVVPGYRGWVDGNNCSDVNTPNTPVCLTQCGNAYQLIQVVNTETRTYHHMFPLRFKNSQFIDCDCPNLHYNGLDEAYIKDNFIWTTFKDGKIYINYQGTLENSEGQLMVPDHPFLNEYYEYALKKKILETLVMSGENVNAQYQLVAAELRAARNNALSLVNTPNFSEMQKVWAMNRKAMYARYYDMFKSYPRPANYNVNNAV
jgi:hypothetical protein